MKNALRWAVTVAGCTALVFELLCCCGGATSPQPPASSSSQDSDDSNLPDDGAIEPYDGPPEDQGSPLPDDGEIEPICWLLVCVPEVTSVGCASVSGRFDAALRCCAVPEIVACPVAEYDVTCTPTNRADWYEPGLCCEEGEVVACPSTRCSDVAPADCDPDRWVDGCCLACDDTAAADCDPARWIGGCCLAPSGDA